MKIEGNYDKFKGLAQERYADRKDELDRWTDDWYRSSQESVSPSKEPVGQPGRKR